MQHHRPANTPVWKIAFVILLAHSLFSERLLRDTGSFSSSKADYTYGDIVHLNSNRYYCFNKEYCSADNPETGTLGAWKKLGTNEAVDLTQDDYLPGNSYTLHQQAKYFQMVWKCKDPDLCSNANYNPVGVYGPDAWIYVSTLVSSLPDNSGTTTNT